MERSMTDLPGNTFAELKTASETSLFKNLDEKFDGKPNPPCFPSTHVKRGETNPRRRSKFLSVAWKLPTKKSSKSFQAMKTDRITGR